jgi:hypothetical protein
MKQLMLVFLFCFTGMAVFAPPACFAQDADMSYYSEEYLRPTATFINRLEVLETVKNLNKTGIGDFYYECLKHLITKIPDIKSKEDRDVVEAMARILSQGLGAEKHTAAAPELWYLVQFFDVLKEINEGLAMQDALVAIGQVGAKDYNSNIVLWLDDLNTRETSDVETRRRYQRGVSGAINALEALKEFDGYKPVFFAFVGWYDPAIREIAHNALPIILDDPGEALGKIIADSSNPPLVKYTAWQEMLKAARAPNSSKAKVAAIALATGWSYATTTPVYQRDLREMRKGAIDIIRLYGVEDNSVYANLEKSYTNNFISNVPDYDEIFKTIDALSVIANDEAVNLLLKFLRDLHTRRRVGPWTINKERQLFQWIVYGLGNSKTKSPDVRMQFTTILRSQDYTGAEHNWVREALSAIGN